MQTSAHYSRKEYSMVPTDYEWFDLYEEIVDAYFTDEEEE